MYKLKLRTERREQFPFARIELGKEFDVLQTAVMHVSAQNAHRNIKRMSYQHYQRTENISDTPHSDQIEADAVELLRDDHARKHKTEQTRITEHIG